MSDGTWHIKYDNDVGPDDDGFWEWWSVTDGTRSFRADSEAEAEWLLAALAKQDAAPTSASTVPEWLPIETALKDGTVVQLWCPANESENKHSPGLPIWFGYCLQDFWCSTIPVLDDANDGGGSLQLSPTHWMPLPKPPVASAVTDGEAKK